MKSRLVATEDRLKAAPLANSGGRVHLLAQTDGGVLKWDAIAERGITVLGYIPDDGLAISAPPDADFSGLGFRWIGTLEAADRRGFTNAASAAQEDAQGYYVVEFYTDVDMGEARALVLGQQIEIRENPSLSATQLLVRGTRAQMKAVSNHDIVVYIFEASVELIQGVPVTACGNPATVYGPVMAIAASLSGGWSASDDQGQVNLTYSFGPLTAGIPADTIRSLFRQAQQQWLAYVKIAFSETANRTSNRNVDLGFYSGAHGDAFPFDGQGGVLAHTFYPAPPNTEPVAGDMHMDADEAWSNSGSGTDFYSVAIHELGHALGLGHSTSPLDVMYPFYRHNTTLSANDSAAIRGLYAARDTAAGSPPAPQPLILTVQSAPPAQVTTAAIGLAGAVTGGQGAIQVTFASDRGAVGVAQGTTNWSITALPLAVGRNTITVQAKDDLATVALQTVVIERAESTPPPPPPPPANTPQPPVIEITSPSGGAVSTSSLTTDIKGTARHPAGIRSISWRATTGASGVASGTISWDTGMVGLVTGVNTVIIDALGLDGGTASKTVQITVTLPSNPPGGGSSDTTPPSLVIASPSTTSVYTSASSITITGTATDNVGVTVVRWEAAVSGGVATGTTNWSTGPIPLFVGMNNIVVRAYDAAGNSGWRSVSVTRQ